MNTFARLLQECGWEAAVDEEFGPIWKVPTGVSWYHEDFVMRANVHEDGDRMKVVEGLQALLEVEPETKYWVKPMLERLGAKPSA